LKGFAYKFVTLCSNPTSKDWLSRIRPARFVGGILK